MDKLKHRHSQLMTRVKEGEIYNLRENVEFDFNAFACGKLRFKNGKKITFRADFCYNERPNGNLVIEAIKSHHELYQIKLALMLNDGYTVKEF